MTRTLEIASNAAASSWTDHTGAILWERMRVGGQADGLTVGIGSGFDLDDDAGAVTLPTRRVFRVTEDATTSPTVLFKGRIADKGVARGQMFDGDARQYDVTLDDSNAQLRGIPVDGWARGAEYGRTRVLAVMAAFAAGSPRASTDIDVATYVPDSNKIMMPAKTYDETDVAEVILDCAQTEGKQAFVTQNDELFYDKDTSTAYAASCSITDDGADELTSFSPFAGVAANQAGNEFFSGGTLKYGDGPATVSDVRAAAETAHDYWRTVLTDGDADATAAAAILGTMLDNQAVEELTYVVDIKVPEDRVDLLAYGQTISFRSAAAAVLSPVTLRIGSLYWEPVGNGVYIAHLELGVPKKWRRRVLKHRNPASTSGVGSGDGCCSPWTCERTDFRVEPLTELACIINASNPGGDRTCRSDNDNTPARTVTLYAGATYKVRYSVFHGPNSWDLRASLLSNSGIEIFIWEAGGYNGSPGYPVSSAEPLSGWIEGTVGTTHTYAAYLRDFVRAGRDGIDSSVFAEIVYVSGSDPRFEGLPPCTNGEPESGHEVRDNNDVGDGATTTGSVSPEQPTPFPYEPTTLRVEVNGRDWTGVVTESDPAAGSYALEYAPPLGSTVRRTYVRA